MSKTSVALAGILILSAGILAAWSVPQGQDPAVLLRAAIVRVDGAAASPDLIYKWAGQFFGLRFHPNGRLLAFSGRPNFSTSSEVWVIENLWEELKLLAPAAKRP